MTDTDTGVTWPDVARLLSDARYAHEHRVVLGPIEPLLLAVEAMAELLTPPAGLTERLIEAVQVEADNPLAGFSPRQYRGEVNGYRLTVTEFSTGWDWLAQEEDGTVLRYYRNDYRHDDGPDRDTAEEAAAEATAWAAAQVTA